MMQSSESATKSNTTLATKKYYICSLVDRTIKIKMNIQKYYFQMVHKTILYAIMSHLKVT